MLPAGTLAAYVDLLSEFRAKAKHGRNQLGHALAIGVIARQMIKI